VLDPRARARLARSGTARAGIAIVAALVLFALVGPLVAHHGPLDSDFVRGVTIDEMPVGPGADFPLGADRVFRDVFARLAYGGRSRTFVFGFGKAALRMVRYEVPTYLTSPPT
jgi:ABC-type dipeptide/oligopeptide/nickel transport system permease subunit